MSKKEQGLRLYQAIERLCMQADTDPDQTVDWLCGEHGGMSKLFLEYFSAKAPNCEPLANQAAIPHGWKLVPVEPTDAMVQAAHHLDLSYMPGQEGADRAAIYRAMLNTAPGPSHEVCLTTQLAPDRKLPAQQEPTVDDDSQDWRGMDGAIAWHLIERHANGWSDVGKMMGEWLEANQPQPAQQQEPVAWCPDVCPITGLPFFMWIEHHETGQNVPTYGGPYDSYTIPVRDKDGSYCRERYDHDRGGWLTDEVEDVGVQIVSDQAYVSDDEPPASKPLTDERVIELEREIERLKEIINTPQSDNFLRAVSTEAEHQRQRWGSEHDAGKAPADWFWLIGYLAGKALHSHAGGNVEKAEHHVITTAAACANWHRGMFGKTNMRPGIDAEAAHGIKGDA